MPRGAPKARPPSVFGPVLAIRLDLAQGRHGPAVLCSSASLGRGPLRPLVGTAAPTFGAGPDASMVVCGATLGRVASQSSRAILIGSIRAVFHQSGHRTLHRPPSRRQTGPVESEPSMPGFWFCADDYAEVRTVTKPDTRAQTPTTGQSPSPICGTQRRKHCLMGTSPHTARFWHSPRFR
jgi:hypothetical protein